MTSICCIFVNFYFAQYISIVFLLLTLTLLFPAQLVLLLYMLEDATQHRKTIVEFVQNKYQRRQTNGDDVILCWMILF